jgi:hypothetical protein
MIPKALSYLHNEYRRCVRHDRLRVGLGCRYRLSLVDTQDASWASSSSLPSAQHQSETRRFRCRYVPAYHQNRRNGRSLQRTDRFPDITAVGGTLSRRLTDRRIQFALSSRKPSALLALHFIKASRRWQDCPVVILVAIILYPHSRDDIHVQQFSSSLYCIRTIILNSLRVYDFR